MRKPAMTLAALAISSVCTLAQVVGTAGAGAGSGANHPANAAEQNTAESTAPGGGAVTIQRQIGTLPRVTTAPALGRVGQLSIGVSLPAPNLPLVRNSPAAIRTPGMTSPSTTFAPGVITFRRP